MDARLAESGRCGGAPLPAGESDGAASRWELERNWFFWAVVTFMNPPAVAIALLLWARELRDR
jgi:hypothetical protein